MVLFIKITLDNNNNVCVERTTEKYEGITYGKDSVLIDPHCQEYRSFLKGFGRKAFHQHCKEMLLK